MSKDQMVLRLVAILDQPPLEAVLGTLTPSEVGACALGHGCEVNYLMGEIDALGGI